MVAGGSISKDGKLINKTWELKDANSIKKNQRFDRRFYLATWPTWLFPTGPLKTATSRTFPQRLPCFFPAKTPFTIQNFLEKSPHS
jgi:hypothetical protein